MPRQYLGRDPGDRTRLAKGAKPAVVLGLHPVTVLPMRLLHIANALVDQHIGLEETDDGIWSIYFNTVLIATLDEREYIIRG
ncbi:MAG: hypothetical protein HY700_12645 [Gemmatimonadetes bacterium]|nr:hypothetical protein [Gemmatimonadota bacterium]